MRFSEKTLTIELMSGFFNTYLYQPILASLVYIYETVAFHDLGIAIILLTILVRVVLFPVFYKSAKDQALMQRLQPHIKKIQLDHKDDKERQAKEMLDLYKRYSLNPFSGILLLLLQLPVFIILFNVLSKELSSGLFLSSTLFGVIELQTKGYVLPVLAAVVQYLQGKLTMGAQKKPKEASADPMASMTSTMMVMGPVLTFFILLNLPTALSLYWMVSSVFSVVQQLYINKQLPKFEDE